jgi:integrase
MRRRAQKADVRPLKLHAARHTYASLALVSGKSVRWVAELLGHANPELTLRSYPHVLREEESDLSFADFGIVRDVSRRRYTSPTDG